jgi:hypothetical protein
MKAFYVALGLLTISMTVLGKGGNNAATAGFGTVATTQMAVWGPSKQAAATAGLAPAAIWSVDNKGRRQFDCFVIGYNLANYPGAINIGAGELVAPLANGDQFLFEVYNNAADATAQAAVWSANKLTTGPATTPAAVSVTAGAIFFPDPLGNPLKFGPGQLIGFRLDSAKTSVILPNARTGKEFCVGKVLQIYGPLIVTTNNKGVVTKATRQVYWTSAPMK